MTWEQATFFVGLAVLIVQGWNAYVTMGIKLWVTKNFVAKEDMSNYLAPMKESIQLMHSDHRNQARR